MTERDSRPVVVGMDGSPDAMRAADYGAWEAGWRGVPLRLVHGVTPSALALAAPYQMYLPDIESTLDAARQMVAQAADELRQNHPDLTITADVISGAPGAVLVAASSEASLVVVGSRGLGGFGGLLAGSVSTQVAAHAHTPVIVVRPSDADKSAGEEGVALRPPGDRDLPGDGDVLVGVDGSPGSAEAIAFAFAQAAARGTGVLAVYAWEIPPSGNLGPVTRWSYDPVDAQREADRLLAEALAGWAEKYPQVPVHRRAEHSFNPGATLVDLSKEASLVVLGSRGRGGFLGLLLGSTSRTLVHHAHCPVAVIHSK